MLFATCWLAICLCFFIYFCTCIYRFFCECKKNNATILTRKSSIFGLILIGVIIILISIITPIYKYGSIVCNDSFLSLFVWSIPLIINYKVFLLEYLFAFNDNVIIGDNLKVDLKDLKIQKVKPISFKMILIESMFDNKQTKKKQKLFLRVSKNRYDMFKTVIQLGC